MFILKTCIGIINLVKAVRIILNANIFLNNNGKKWDWFMVHYIFWFVQLLVSWNLIKYAFLKKFKIT